MNDQELAFLIDKLSDDNIEELKNTYCVLDLLSQDELNDILETWGVEEKQNPDYYYEEAKYCIAKYFNELRFKDKKEAIEDYKIKAKQHIQNMFKKEVENKILDETEDVNDIIQSNIDNIPFEEDNDDDLEFGKVLSNICEKMNKTIKTIQGIVRQNKVKKECKVDSLALENLWTLYVRKNGSNVSAQEFNEIKNNVDKIKEKFKAMFLYDIKETELAQFVTNNSKDILNGNIDNIIQIIIEIEFQKQSYRNFIERMSTKEELCGRKKPMLSLIMLGIRFDNLKSKVLKEKSNNYEKAQSFLVDLYLNMQKYYDNAYEFFEGVVNNIKCNKSQKTILEDIIRASCKDYAMEKTKSAFDLKSPNSPIKANTAFSATDDDYDIKKYSFLFEKLQNKICDKILKKYNIPKFSKEYLAVKQTICIWDSKQEKFILDDLNLIQEKYSSKKDSLLNQMSEIFKEYGTREKEVEETILPTFKKFEKFEEEKKKIEARGIPVVRRNPYKSTISKLKKKYCFVKPKKENLFCGTHLYNYNESNTKVINENSNTISNNFVTFRNTKGVVNDNNQRKYKKKVQNLPFINEISNTIFSNNFSTFGKTKGVVNDNNKQKYKKKYTKFPKIKQHNGLSTTKKYNMFNCVNNNECANNETFRQTAAFGVNRNL